MYNNHYGLEGDTCIWLYIYNMYKCMWAWGGGACGCGCVSVADIYVYFFYSYSLHFLYT